MKAPFLCLVLAALPALGEHQEISLAPIGLYMQFQQPPPAAVADALKAEVDSIMRPSGLRFTWRELLAARGSDFSVALAVITFKGRCDVIGLNPHASYTGPLGWTEISDGVILPFAEVDCQFVRDFIQRQLLRMPPESRGATYGRALGRVLAHELYHIFANTTSHSSYGVGKSKFTVQDLVSPEFQFEAQESLTLKGSKAYAALQGPAIGR
jgi:hypothetical protein